MRLMQQSIIKVGDQNPQIILGTNLLVCEYQLHCDVYAIIDEDTLECECVKSIQTKSPLTAAARMGDEYNTESPWYKSRTDCIFMVNCETDYGDSLHNEVIGVSTSFDKAEAFTRSFVPGPDEYISLEMMKGL